MKINSKFYLIFSPTRAITARALVLALAYPAMQPAVRELFDDKVDFDGNPIFDIVPAYIFGLNGHVLDFSSLQRLVNVKYKGWGVAVGFLHTANDKLELAPGLNYRRAWSADMKIVTIQRSFKSHITPPC